MVMMTERKLLSQRAFVVAEGTELKEGESGIARAVIFPAYKGRRDDSGRFCTATRKTTLLAGLPAS
ncbi:hypothetical protein OGY18_00625 [Citrobacter sp. Cpo142]|uniref:hypothetical protein n=1 Tax=Citrobacter TaxID=544 RepID=UPI001902B4D2|nr:MULTISPECIES: hypothetical protein [Citrobacter]MBJ9109981.1 hypothetical protein [Citrobacter sp. FDAARGOS_156]MBK6259087.1 hypothetical protein [Citrobacter youngae]MDM2775678.1 hypothetical protein [Citrobacter sp. Cpo142]WFZ28192.1 hypothetical protein NFK62_19115 [Citrobacter portucalensis]WFZ33192.1 hypothetical protein NFK63_19110 [Citrobacter portucalensis]